MYKLAIIGVGKMGNAILNGIINSKLMNKEDILLVVHRKEQQEELLHNGYIVTLNIKEAYENASMILMAVKPQMFPEVLKDSSSYDFKDKCILSIAAGIKISQLHEYFNNALIVRGMPNTSALINQSVTTICSDDTSSPYYKKAYDILASIGKVVEIKEEEMDITLPLNGSMPAYIYYFIKCFIEVAMKNGLDEVRAKQLVIDTIIGSCNMLIDNTTSLQTLIDNVCSKKGTTIAGLEKLYDNDMNKAITECYEACMNRSKELSK